jgi:hypothetical protein
MSESTEKNKEQDAVQTEKAPGGSLLSWKSAERARFPGQRIYTQAISLRLPVSMLDELRYIAEQRNMRYQALIKVFLRERINQEYRLTKGTVHEEQAEYKVDKKKKK